jgi:hypothetical protein
MTALEPLVRELPRGLDDLKLRHLRVGYAPARMRAQRAER